MTGINGWSGIQVFQVAEDTVQRFAALVETIDLPAYGFALPVQRVNVDLDIHAAGWALDANGVLWRAADLDTDVPLLYPILLPKLPPDAGQHPHDRC